MKKLVIIDDNALSELKAKRNILLEGKTKRAAIIKKMVGDGKVQYERDVDFLFLSVLMILVLGKYMTVSQ